MHASYDMRGQIALILVFYIVLYTILYVWKVTAELTAF